MKQLLLLAFFLKAFLFVQNSWAQVTLSSSPYTQDFNSISSGLPTGWTVRTGATSSVLGTTAALTTTATAWSNTSGSFKNFASANGLTSSTTSAIQNTQTDRAIGVRQTGTFGDPGSAFVLQLANTSGLTGFSLSFKLQSLDGTSSAGRTATWRVDYGIGASPTTFTPVTTSPSSLTTVLPVFANTDVTADFGAALDNINDIVWIRIVCLSTATGSGSRPTTAIDDFSLSYVDLTPPIFTSTYPQSSTISSTGFDLAVNLNEKGKVYYVVLADGANTPSAAQVKAGQDGQGNAIVNSGSVAVSTSGTNFTQTISGLSSNTNYDVYVVAEDAVSNLQTSATLLDVMTNVAPSISPSVSSVTFSGFTDKSKQSGSTSYTISASNLIADVTVSVSGNFLLSSDNNTFTTSLNILAANLSSPQTIYVKFNPSGNTGTQTGTITHSSSGATDKTVSLSAIGIDPYNQNFNDPGFLTNTGWTQYSVTGAQAWGSTNFGHTCLTGCNSSTVDKAAQINGFSGAAQTNEDWLISPQLDLTTFTNYPALSFATISAFAGDALQLKYSTDYSGSGDPALATWTSIDGKFPTSNSSKWTTSSTIILPKSSIYVVFIYTSSTTAASRWTLDDWKVENVSSYINLPSINFSFGEIVAGNSSASQNFNLTAQGYGDITVSMSTAFEASLDNTSFSSSVIITEADAAAGKTVYTRFSPLTKQLKWTGAVSFTGTGLNSVSGSLSGSSYPKSETFNIATYNLEFFGTDVRNASDVEFGPTDDALQVANVTTVMQNIAADIFAVEEISDDNAFAQLVSNLSGYDKVLSTRWSYSWQAPDPNFPPQKIGFIYNTSRAQLVSSRVMFASMYDSIIAGKKTLPSYPTGTSSSFWSSGRLPFMVTFDVTINGSKRRIRMIDIHGKSASDQESYNRRVYDAKVLRDSLNAYYPHDNIILLGDFNDQVYGSITNGAVSSYNNFVDDVNNFKAVTYDLNVAGASTYPNSTSFIDNIIISNELINAYVANSVEVEDARSYINNYISTTSDHLPVWSRFLLSSKADQDLTFNALPSKTYVDAKFTLSATTSSGLPASFTSSDPSVLSLSGNVATILKAGTITITASQSGSDDFNAAVSVTQSLTINKADQAISFEPISSKVIGEGSFALSVTSTSGLPVTFSSTSDKITIAADQVTINKAGRVSITVSQPGNENYNAATSIEQSFCINPAKPAISISDAITATPTLTSSVSNGNQWYFNGTVIANTSDVSLVVTAQGTYKVQAHADDCFGEFSDDKTVVITAVDDAVKTISIYPNPAEDYIFLSGVEDMPQLQISDVAGRTFAISFEKFNEVYRINVRELISGFYVLKLNDGNKIQTFKFIKK